MKTCKRVLLLANNCLSYTNANGRTLLNFFKGYDKDCLAQFFVKEGDPAFDICDNYFQVTDGEALRAFKRKQKVGKVLEKPAQDVVVKPKQNVKSKSKRTPLTMLLRELVWNSNKWKGEAFEAWLDAFNPEVVLVFNGDNAFLLKIATDIAKKRNIPLMLYNCEWYYFRKKNYMVNCGWTSILYPWFIRKYRKQFEKTIKQAAYSVYNSEALERAYNSVFHKPSTTIYTATDMADNEAHIKSVREALGCLGEQKSEDNRAPVVTYLGNLGWERPEGLIAIANALQSIDENWCLDVYARFPTEEIEKQMLACKGIRHKGFVAYNEVLQVMQNSDVLVHTESFSPFRKKDLEFGFSTKIADCLASGACFFFYAPIDLVSAKYLKENNAACVVTEQESLKTELESILRNPARRKEYVENALVLAQRNHSVLKNREKMWEAVKTAAESGSLSPLKK